jgi:hypothetical protein
VKTGGRQRRSCTPSSVGHPNNWIPQRRAGIHSASLGALHNDDLEDSFLKFNTGPATLPRSFRVSTLSVESK